MYRLFFHTALAVQRAAIRREAGGKDATGLREYFTHKGMTAAENGVIFQVAEDEAAAEQPVQQQAQGVIQQFRQAMKAYKLGEASMPKPPTAELKTLQSERDSIAMNARAQLHQLLGDDGFDRLELYVHGSFGRARHMTLKLPLGAATKGGGR